MNNFDFIHWILDDSLIILVTVIKFTLNLNNNYCFNINSNNN